MTLTVVLLIVVVALLGGGYDLGGGLVLELGAVGLVFWVLVEIQRGTRADKRVRLQEQRRAWKRLPFFVRHPRVGTVLHLASLGRFPKRYGSSGVEILPPGTSKDVEMWSPQSSRYFLLGGYPFKRTWLGLPLLMLTLWMGLSVVPIGRDVLEYLSPQAHALRAEAESLVRPEVQPGPAPWSLSPFLSLRGLWLWLAYLALFYVGAHLAERPGEVDRLAYFLLLVGVAYGMYGVGQWLVGLQGLFGADPSTAGLRINGSFENWDHYAAFMEMLLLCSLGWLGARRVLFRAARGAGGAGRKPGRKANIMVQEAQARLFLVGLGIALLCLGLVFSLSRSGITFAIVACAAFSLLAKPRLQSEDAGIIELERSEHGQSRLRRDKKRRPAGHFYWALGLAVVAAVLWIGMEPILSRFEQLPDTWVGEASRRQVWTDSMGIVKDFWLTGSGLSSYTYVFPMYRTFGGEIFWAYAHNDYLQLLVELGAPGMVLLIWTLAAVWRGARRVRRDLGGDPSLMYLHTGFCCALIAIALHSFTDFSLHMPANAALLSVILGVAVGMVPDKEKELGRKNQDLGFVSVAC